MQTLAHIDTQLTDRQACTFGPQPIIGYGSGAEITAIVRFDDRYNNGHNTLAITVDVTTPESRRRRDSVGGNNLHDGVIAFPELASLVRWHLVSTDGPLHYIENTMYWLGRRGYTRWDNDRTGRPCTPTDPPNLDHARKAACWPDLPESFVITGTSVSNAIVQAALMDRLPGLLTEFRAAIEALGFAW